MAELDFAPNSPWNSPCFFTQLRQSPAANYLGSTDIVCFANPGGFCCDMSQVSRELERSSRQARNTVPSSDAMFPRREGHLEVQPAGAKIAEKRSRRDSQALFAFCTWHANRKREKARTGLRAGGPAARWLVLRARNLGVTS